MNQKPVFLLKTDAEIVEILAGLGQPKFRVKQIREWLMRGAPDFASMKNLPADLRKGLDEQFVTLPAKIIQKLTSADKQTTKFLFEMVDGQKIESVLMRTTYGNSVCVSSQAGCAMGCKFCASGLNGLTRNLTAMEMAAQVLLCNFELYLDGKGTEVTHVVVMGTGEPLLNLENLKGFVSFLNHDMKISYRRITVSTCGIVPGILDIRDWNVPVNLAISLHAPNDELRDKIMPINSKYKIQDVMDSGFEYAAASGRQLMVEYILLGGFNDSVENAGQLSQLLAGKNVMVNIIPWNAVAEHDFTAASGNAVHRFQDVLIKNGIHARIRKERGADIGSACGQLRKQ